MASENEKLEDIWKAIPEPIRLAWKTAYDHARLEKMRAECFLYYQLKSTNRPQNTEQWIRAFNSSFKRSSEFEQAKKGPAFKSTPKSFDPLDSKRKELASMQQRSWVPEPCIHCFNSGIIDAHKIGDERYRYSFGCTCAAGQLAMQLPENKNTIRAWHDDFLDEWKIIR